MKLAVCPLKGSGVLLKQHGSNTLATAQQGKSDDLDGVTSAETDSFCWQNQLTLTFF